MRIRVAEGPKNSADCMKEGMRGLKFSRSERLLHLHMAVGKEAPIERN